MFYKLETQALQPTCLVLGTCSHALSRLCTINPAELRSVDSGGSQSSSSFYPVTVKSGPSPSRAPAREAPSMTFSFSFWFSLQSCAYNAVPISQVRKLRFRVLLWLVQGRISRVCILWRVASRLRLFSWIPAQLWFVARTHYWCSPIPILSAPPTSPFVTW